SFKIVPNVVEIEVTISVKLSKAEARFSTAVYVLDGAREIAYENLGGNHTNVLIFHFKIRNPKLWTPESPFLYGLRIKDWLSHDEVKSYFAMRKISLSKYEKDFTR